MPVSIKDIARLAGVSHSTVSRALRYSPLIPQDTAQRIREIAQDNGYAASAIARSLVTRKTFSIGVVVTSIADPFNGEIVEGLEQVANEHGYSVILATSQAAPEREIAVVRGFQERRVDGIVVASSRVGSLYASLLGDMQIPIVLLNNQSQAGVAESVSIDNVDGGFRSTRHLIEIGHTRIGYLGDRFGLQSDAERLRGYRKALKLAAIPYREQLVARGDGKTAGARQAAADLLLERPTAIFCYNDMSALGVIEQAALQKLHIPRELSVVGFDDLFFTSYLRPPLTTFRQPKREIGRRAMQQLLSALQGEQAGTNTLVKGELIVRGSTAPPTRRSGPGKTRKPGPGNRA